MMYTVIYDKDGQCEWERFTTIEDAERFAKQNTNGAYDICVSLYEYDSLKNKIEILKKTLNQIVKICTSI